MRTRTSTPWCKWRRTGRSDKPTALHDIRPHVPRGHYCRPVSLQRVAHSRATFGLRGGSGISMYFEVPHPGPFSEPQIRQHKTGTDSKCPFCVGRFVGRKTAPWMGTPCPTSFLARPRGHHQQLGHVHGMLRHTPPCDRRFAKHLASVWSPVVTATSCCKMTAAGTCRHFADRLTECTLDCAKTAPVRVHRLRRQRRSENEIRKENRSTLASCEHHIPTPGGRRLTPLTKYTMFDGTTRNTSTQHAPQACGIQTNS